MATRVLVLCLFVVAAVPREAAADWHFIPMVGFTTFGDTSLFDPEGGSGHTHLNLGGGVAWLSSGIIGVEGLVTWTPNFFEGEPTAVTIRSSRSVSLMGNLVVTLPQRWTEYGLRPFVSGGFGLMHARHVDERQLFPVQGNALGFNVGGGAVGFLSDRTGVRFDVRYHSTLRIDGVPTALPAFGEPHLRYLTFSVGVVIRR